MSKQSIPIVGRHGDSACSGSLTIAKGIGGISITLQSPRLSAKYKFHGNTGMPYDDNMWSADICKAIGRAGEDYTKLQDRVRSDTMLAMLDMLSHAQLVAMAFARKYKDLQAGAFAKAIQEVQEQCNMQ